MVSLCASRGKCDPVSQHCHLSVHLHAAPALHPGS